MTNQKGYYAPPAAGYGLYLIVRALWHAVNSGDRRGVTATPRPAPVPPQRVIITPPPKPRPDPAHHQTAPPVVRWTGDRELVAWRAWRLAILLQDDVDQTGPRLLSLAAPCIWDGPAIRAVVIPTWRAEHPSGIYALKPEVAPHHAWTRGEHCWVTGLVALSGRVIEHEAGYRAERAVIRELRLGVGTHLAVRTVEMLRNVMQCLEKRYQAPVDAGHAEREVADRMLAQRVKPACPELPLMSLQPPWQIC